MNKLFFSFIILLSLTGCATFSDSYTNGNIEKLNNRNLDQLNGTYQVYASGKYNQKGHFTAISTSKKKYPFNNKIENKIPDLKVKNAKDIGEIIKNPPIDSIPSLQNNYDEVEVKVKNDYISFNLLKNGRTSKTLTYKGILKNGFLYLPKEKNCVKIPSYTNCIKSQRRIGLGDDGNLILHEYNDVKASSDYTAFFLSFFEGNGDGVYKYDKIK